MEYLPEKINLHVVKKEKEDKLTSFREYIADNDVVMAFVKYLLHVRKQAPWVDDPLKELHSYFDDYRSPEWDIVEGVKNDNVKMEKEVIPELQEKILELEKEIKIAKRYTRSNKVYKALDLEGTDLIGTKGMIAKLSGNAKFDTDTKMSLKQFYYLIIHICENGEDDEIFDKFISYFEKSVEEEATPPFAGDLENIDLVKIQEQIRSFEPPEIKEEKDEGEQEKEKE
mmetsp:Transcript_27333/g.24215  ORF Transcript_27333/g.24215 Transcript_27333/m.24215 type:complete len:227 (+) Transcript_27333:54-734(+)